MLARFYSRQLKFTTLTLVLGALLTACGSGDEKKPEKRDENTDFFKYEMSCSGGPELKKSERKTGKLRESGPVALEHPNTKKNLSCEETAKLREELLAKLKRNGTWTAFHTTTGKKFWVGEYKNDLQEGVFKYFSEEGDLSRETTYQNGLQHGPDTAYYAGTGDWRIKGQYEKGKRAGYWQTKIHKSSDCVSAGNYVDGKKSGEWQECVAATIDRKQVYYVQWKGNYERDLKSGPAKEFYHNGNLAGEGSYYADFECVKEPPKGKVENCGKQAGEWTYYHLTGKPAARGSYEQATGMMSGTWVEFYQTGAKLAEGVREKNIRVGMWTVWDKKGDILGRFKFESDFFFRSGEIYENGRKVAEALPKAGGDAAGTFSQGLFSYDPEKDIVNLTVKFKMGRWALYDASGNKTAEGSFSADKRNGKWTFFEGGRVVQKGEFMMDKKHGTWEILQGGSWVTEEWFFGRKK